MTHAYTSWYIVNLYRHRKPKVVNPSAPQPPVAPWVVIMTTQGASNGNQAAKSTIHRHQWWSLGLSRWPPRSHKRCREVTLTSPSSSEVRKRNMHLIYRWLRLTMERSVGYKFRKWCLMPNEKPWMLWIAIISNKWSGTEFTKPGK